MNYKSLVKAMQAWSDAWARDALKMSESGRWPNYLITTLEEARDGDMRRVPWTLEDVLKASIATLEGWSESRAQHERLLSGLKAMGFPQKEVDSLMAGAHPAQRSRL